MDSPFFNAIALYLEIVLKRNQKEFCGIDELLGNALANAKLIELAASLLQLLRRLLHSRNKNPDQIRINCAIQQLNILPAL